ncbi:hypothetical protein COLO4_24567 [Corchorus olitorius]|uniref:Uncharacterized protein n=1 Tax=Corchorus olitorius TaxID=93759 RepID=A0A1R3I909_9ROSI|nr:hypothetical protein COLO4_24567 [Corchorus olitorius]
MAVYSLSKMGSLWVSRTKNERCKDRVFEMRKQDAPFSRRKRPSARVGVRCGKSVEREDGVSEK